MLAALLCMVSVSCTKEEKVELELSATEVEVVIPKAFFNVTSNRAWTLSQSGDYTFSVSPTSGMAGTTAVNISYTPNTTGKERSSTLTITADGQTKNVSVFQPALEFSLSPEVLEFEAAESTKSIIVTTNAAWNIDGITVPDWIKSISAKNPAGNGEIVITVKENTSRISANTWLLRVNYAGSLSKTVEIMQSAAYNAPPTKPSGLVPENNATSISVMPDFSWTGSTDADGDEISYYVYLSQDGTNWKRFSAGKATSVALPNSYGILEPNTTYYYKVVADDAHNKGITESDINKFTTSEKDAYADGDFKLYMESKKSNPVVLIFTGDGYMAEDHKYRGAFDTDTDEAIEAFFDIEPYRSYKEYFTVYKLAAYSPERGLSNKSTNSIKNTKFGLLWDGGNSTGINCPNSGAAVFEWCKKIPGVSDASLADMAIGIVINADVYAGTCLSFANGKSIAMIPYLRTGSNMTKFGNVVRHEMGGHGFGRLSDEYVNYQSEMPESEKENTALWQDFGYGLNISLYPAMSDSPWAHFAGLSDYSHVGMYEGGHYYAKGVWRPEVISCMEDNRNYYNSPSRFYIVKRILEISKEVDPITKDDSDQVKAQKMKILMDKFLAKDVEKTDKNSSNTKSGWNGVPYDFVPLGSPVLIIE